MDSWDDLPQLNENDLAARRIASLALALINARRPLTTDELRRDLYPDLSYEGFKKAFLRDRERVALTGLVVRQQTNQAGDTCWSVDEEASFVQENLLSQEDALFLDFLLLPLAADPSLPYARDLQVALAKIDRSFDGSTEVALPPEARKHAKSLAVVEGALARRHSLRITYRRADDTQTTRVVAPYGLFSFRAQPYLVAARVDEQGTVSEEDPHTYVVERILKVREGKSSYEIPADFDVRDFIKLPFQMGEPVATGIFVDPATGDRRVEDIHDLGLAASWALAKGLLPDGPAELVEAWQSQIRHARQALSHWQDLIDEAKRTCAQSAGRRAAPRGRGKRRGAGRPQNTDKVRELVALIGSLCMTGDSITLDAVSKRLGLSLDEARTTMEIVCETGGEESGGLLISCNDDETEFTLQYPATHGRPVRLTEIETVAVVRALDAAGLADDDPLRTKLSNAFTSPQVQTELVRQALGAPLGTGDAVVSVCAKAQAQGRSLVFGYKGAKDQSARRRRAVVRSLVPQADLWHVRAYDLDAHEDRTFRTDRMTDVTLGNTHELPQAHTSEARSVVCYLCDRLYYPAFSWHNAQNVVDTGTIIRFELPYYGSQSTWLPRRIMACGGSLVVDDDQVRAAAEHYARGYKGE